MAGSNIIIFPPSNLWLTTTTAATRSFATDNKLEELCPTTHAMDSRFHFLPGVSFVLLLDVTTAVNPFDIIALPPAPSAPNRKKGSWRLSRLILAWRETKSLVNGITGDDSYDTQKR